MGEQVLSALFVMMVVFLVLVILYVLMKVFSAIVRAIETNIIDSNDVKKGGA
jgi:Na+-transporting methylmalonyl-CoA/oxaloacetate decarboxylase gamma subunit